MPLNSLNDFIPVGEATVVHDVVQLFVRRGKEFSVYSIDWEQEVVVLIRPVDGVDLKAHPFFREVCIVFLFITFAEKVIFSIMT